MKRKTQHLDVQDTVLPGFDGVARAADRAMQEEDALIEGLLTREIPSGLRPRR